MPASKKNRARGILPLAMLLVACQCLSGCGNRSANRSGKDPVVRVRPDLVLPNVHFAKTKTAVTAPFSKNYSLSQDWFTFDIPLLEQALSSLKGKAGIRYLEIGAFEGRSMLWMMENILTDATSRAVVMDPFTGDYKERYRANLELSGFGDRVTTIVGYSQIELRNQKLDSFDCIYVDGSHTTDDVLEDAVLCLRLLKRGGILIFDDYRWAGPTGGEPPEDTPGPAIDIFYAVYGKQFQILHKGYQVILEKK